MLLPVYQTLLSLLVIFLCFKRSAPQQEKADDFLKKYNVEFAKITNIKYNAIFNRAVNITDQTKKVEKEAGDMYRREYVKVMREARQVNLTGVDANTRRQFEMIFKTKEARNKTIAKLVEDLATDMKNIYGTTEVPFDSKYIKSIPKDGDLLGLGQLMQIMGKSQDPDELLYVWKSWRKATRERLRDKYVRYVELNNIGARENGFSDAGEYHRSSYDVDDLKSIVDNFLSDMQPFYRELHGFIRHKLRKLYPKLIDPKGPIPAHLVGNIWAQSWEELYKRVVPYPDEPSLDVTPTLEKKKTPLGMVEMAEDFFVSLGWQKLPQTFWKGSVFVQPKGRIMECYPSAMDLRVKMNAEPDVRIKMCMRRTQRDFIVIHHEIGHIYYDLFYWNQPLQYRDGANPGFHEAVGDFIALSVQTPAHLNAVGLLDKVSQTTEADINFLMKMALEQISFLPFAFVMDQWMWGVYSGDITPREYNAKWWEYREKYQGIVNPLKGGEKVDDDEMGGFDPGAKFHIPGDVPYIRYFFASILMFTFHKTSCDLSNNTKPLHQCSIYKSKAAGKAFGDMLALGRSKPWRVALKQFTGSEDISVEPVKEYFQPLSAWLQKYRKDNGYELGWEKKGRKTNSSSKSMKSGDFQLFIVLLFTIFTMKLTMAVL